MNSKKILKNKNQKRKRIQNEVKWKGVKTNFEKTVPFLATAVYKENFLLLFLFSYLVLLYFILFTFDGNVCVEASRASAKNLKKFFVQIEFAFKVCIEYMAGQMSESSRTT